MNTPAATVVKAAGVAGPASHANATGQLMGAADGLRYGMMGLPLAFIALPLYIILPHHYAQTFGMPLATLGALLLAARLFDAVIDPLLGRATDALFARSLPALLGFAALAAAALAVGFGLLFFPPTSIAQAPMSLIVWALATLLVTYTAYSALSIAHQSWGAMLGGNEAERGRIVAWREGLALVGVVVASVAPTALGLSWSVAIFSIALTVGVLLWARAPRPQPQAGHGKEAMWLPFTRPSFIRLLVVYVFNGIASAVSATLILFFVQDRLQAPQAMEPLFLGSYFLSAALALPLWMRLVPRLGLARTWGAGMLLAMAAFAFTSRLGAGDAWGFVAVCVASGVALGPDLAVPGALLAGLIGQAGDQGRAEGAYFGWWNFCTKLNLALAAGLALPLLAALGYAPGARDAQALSALSFAYCVVPFALKLTAACLLYTLFLRKNPSS